MTWHLGLLCLNEKQLHCQQDDVDFLNHLGQMRNICSMKGFVSWDA